MKISNNADEVAKSLDLVIEEIERKLKNMVVGFAGDVALSASEHTPIGSEWSLANNDAYHSYYVSRNQEWNIPIEVGYHKGAWQYSEGSLTFTPVIYSQHSMISDVESAAKISYQLGDSFKIGAKGPGYSALENGSSRQATNGIMQPTVASIMTAHSSDLKRHYDNYK